MNLLQKEDDVVRHVKGTQIDSDGVVGAGAFMLKDGEQGLSVNWISFFRGTEEEKIQAVRQILRLERKQSHRLAQFNVATVTNHLREKLPNLSFIKVPLEAMTDSKGKHHDHDGSHAEIIGLPHSPYDRAREVGNMIAQCVSKLHPAL
jgi:hypothetical protein